MNATDDGFPATAADENHLDRDGLAVIERALIGGCLTDPSGIAEVEHLVRADDFSVYAHRSVWAAMTGLHEARREVSLAAVYEELRRDGRDKELGPNPPYWLYEARCDEPTAVNAHFYATKVLDAAVLRRLAVAARSILHDAASPTGPAMEVVAAAEGRVLEVANRGRESGRVREAPEMATDAMRRIDDRAAAGGRIAGLSTGLDDLDAVTGGLAGGQMVVIGARPGGGKTAIGLNVARRAAARGEAVLFFSMEMPEAQITDRLIAQWSGVPMSSITRGVLTPEQTDRVVAAAGAYRACAFFVDDSPELDAYQMRHTARRLARKSGLGLVVVDYLQLMRPADAKENRTQQVGGLAREVKRLARECEVPVLCLCQLNREVENRGGDGRPRLADLRESGEIEQHADMVWLLHTKPGQSAELSAWDVDLIVAKNRNGPIGDVALSYVRPAMRFEPRRAG